jgi:hypothetical protein
MKIAKTVSLSRGRLFQVGRVAALILILLSTACSGQAGKTPTPSPATTIPTAAPTLTPTPKPTLTPTPEIPKIEVGGLAIPDPRDSNPELFDLKNPDSPVVQFANAFGVKPEDVVSGLHIQIETPYGLPPFVVLRTTNNYKSVALMIARQNAEGKWQWSEATIANYWRGYNRDIGVYVNTEQLKDPESQEIIKRYFKNGLLAWGGDLSNTSNANKLEAEASYLNASYLGIAVAEPGKFQKDVNVTNIDQWLNQRLTNIAQLIKNKKPTGSPTYVNFNEAWGETYGWNPESNPLRNKYGDNNWVSEYIYRIVLIFVDQELTPNKDFIIMFNDARLYNRPNKQDYIFNSLLKARQDAFDKLMADPRIKQKLNEMGIKSQNDIQIILGSETHTKLGLNEDSVNFWPTPTAEEIENLAKKFEPLGGVLITEINPFGNLKQKEEFLKLLNKSIKTPGIRGLLFWNVLKNSDVGNPNYPLIADPLTLFNEDGSPTPLYYELLSNSQ